MSSAFPKIAHVVCTYPPYHGGMGRVAFEYTERLRARGYNVHVFTSRHDHPQPSSRLRLTGQPILVKEGSSDPDYVHRVPAVLSIGNASIMPSLFQRLSGFDLVHLHYPFYGGAEPVIVRKALRPNQGLVMTYHMDAVAGGIRGAIFEAHKRLLFPWIINRVDRILVSSKEYADTSSLKDIPGIMDRVEVHPFGIDLEKFYPGSDHALRESLSIDLSIPVLLFVGGLDEAHHFKGLPVLFESLKELKHLPWQLVVVGDGNLRPTYEALAKMHGI
ncbi:MAG: glycosyltransferase, partial [Patescibacteria group bacterium]